MGCTLGFWRVTTGLYAPIFVLPSKQDRATLGGWLFDLSLVLLDRGWGNLITFVAHRSPSHLAEALRGRRERDAGTAVWEKEVERIEESQ